MNQQRSTAPMSDDQVLETVIMTVVGLAGWAGLWATCPRSRIGWWPAASWVRGVSDADSCRAPAVLGWTGRGSRCGRDRRGADLVVGDLGGAGGPARQGPGGQEHEISVVVETGSPGTSGCGSAGCGPPAGESRACGLSGRHELAQSPEEAVAAAVPLVALCAGCSVVSECGLWAVTEHYDGIAAGTVWAVPGSSGPWVGCAASPVWPSLRRRAAPVRIEGWRDPHRLDRSGSGWRRVCCRTPRLPTLRLVGLWSAPWPGPWCEVVPVPAAWSVIRTGRWTGWGGSRRWHRPCGCSDRCHNLALSGTSSFRRTPRRRTKGRLGDGSGVGVIGWLATSCSGCRPFR